MSHILITGHTGFKGSWLALLLRQLGHEVSGVALDPNEKSLFSMARIQEIHKHDFRRDIRNYALVADSLIESSPDIVMHLAAQPLVRRSYEQPRETVETNVMGTYNVLSAVSQTPSVRALLVATTDKVYRPLPSGSSCREQDALGGEDIYSASKAMADILTFAWGRSFGGPPIAVARAGNVIGGGDYGQDRLLPELMSAFCEERSPELRFPEAVRPWQHVLDCLAGYVAIVEDLLATDDARPPVPWNVGPGEGTYTTVGDLATRAGAAWGSVPGWRVGETPSRAENQWLALNTEKIRAALGWHDKLGLQASIDWTVDWFKQVSSGRDPATVSKEQVERFLLLPRASI